MTDIGFSVIIPVFNREQFIEKCIQSILQQTYNGNIEILVSDDGSTDRTIDIVKSFNRSEIKIITKPATCKIQGPSSARNRAMAVAKYSFIAFLDSDDCYYPDHLRNLCNTFMESKDVMLVYADCICQDYTTGVQWKKKYSHNANLKLNESLLLDSFFPPSVVAIRKDVLNIVEPFDEQLRGAEDQDFHLRILEKFQGKYIPVNGAIYQMNHNQLCADEIKIFKYALTTLNKAKKRYPYSHGLVSKRKAVIYYHFFSGYIKSKKYFLGIFYAFLSFFYDPLRALQVVFSYFSKIGNFFQRQKK